MRLEGTKLMLGFLDRSSAIAWAAYNFLISICVYPYFSTAVLMSLAAYASASDLIIWADFSSSSLSTINFCLSAICCWTALLSIACAYSLLNPKCMKLTSSTLMLNSFAFSKSWVLIYLLMTSLFLRSWSASSKLEWSNIEQLLFWGFLVRWSWRLSFHSLFPAIDGWLEGLQR